MTSIYWRLISIQTDRLTARSEPSQEEIKTPICSQLLIIIIIIIVIILLLIKYNFSFFFSIVGWQDK